MTTKDLGWPAPGVHQYAVVVGTKKNPAFTPGATFDPAKDVLDMTKHPEFIPDTRILNLNGAEDKNAIIAKLDNIKKSLPENREIPKMDDTITSINQNPQKLYADPAEEAFKAEQERIANHPLTVPAPAAPDMTEVLESLMSAVENLTARIENMELKTQENKTTKEKAKK